MFKIYVTILCYLQIKIWSLSIEQEVNCKLQIYKASIDRTECVNSQYKLLKVSKRSKYISQLFIIYR